MNTLALKVRSILRREGYISIMNLIESKEYAPEEILIEAIRINHADLVDMLMDEYAELRTTPRILDKIFYLTNLTHIPRLKEIVLSYLPPTLRVRYSNIRLARRSARKK
jgi:hypothetical protein